MTAPPPQRLTDLPQQRNPYTDQSPLVVRDHPWRENRPTLVIGAVVAAAPVIWLLARLVSGARPVMSGPLVLALAIGLPLGAVIALFPLLLSSGAKVTLGASTLTREVSGRRGRTKSAELADITGGIYASKVRYRREHGKELVLFLPERQVLWIADGITADDIERIAHALSAYGIKEYAEPIGNDALQKIVRAAVRADPEADPARKVGSSAESGEVSPLSGEKPTR